MHHLNDQIKASLDQRLANHVLETSKTKVPKDGSFQRFLESIVVAKSLKARSWIYGAVSALCSNMLVKAFFRVIMHAM